MAETRTAIRGETHVKSAEHPTDYWTKKPRTGVGSWDAYWQTLRAPHRDALVEALRKLPAFTSLLEVGCGPGVNLWRVLEAFPHVTLGGFDVSPDAIAVAHERFQGAERSGALSGKGDIYLGVGVLPFSLAQVEPVDVLLSCYTLAYVPPRLFAETLQAMTQAARQAIVLAEPMVVLGDFAGISAQIHTIRDSAGQVVQREFKHDYRTWFVDHAGPEWSITSMKPLNVDRMNRILVAERRAS
jgi:SAM-dependent methyltransferase